MMKATVTVLSVGPVMTLTRDSDNLSFANCVSDDVMLTIVMMATATALRTDPVMVLMRDDDLFCFSCQLCS